ncbi:MAG TPA: fatty acid desaturase, partial [Actinomycetota bacterium]|nr:fatty acid desaturase [Actinomycetota bacterium]
MAQATALAREETRPDQVGNTFIPSLKVHRLERRMTLAITLLPFLGLAIGIPILWGRGVGRLDAALLIGFYLVTGLGVTAGFHRMFTHRSFDGPEWLRVAFAVAGSMAIQGPVIRWVADHRRHHAFTDRPGDPHSPHLEEAEGWRGVLRGLWHSHIGWFFDREATNIPRYAPDLLKEKPMVWVDRTFPLWVVVSFLAPAAIGALVTGTLAGALSAFIWGGLLRIFLLHHVTWSI